MPNVTIENLTGGVMPLQDPSGYSPFSLSLGPSGSSTASKTVFLDAQTLEHMSPVLDLAQSLGRLSWSSAAAVRDEPVELTLTDKGVGPAGLSASGPVALYLDPAGNDNNKGTAAAPLQTFEAAMDRKPAVYYGALDFFLNKDGVTSLQNTTRKTYTLSNNVLRFIMPLAKGKLAQTPRIIGGLTNELGDKTATAGSSTSLTTDQNFTLNQYEGAIISLIAGTGAGQHKIIDSNTAGPNSVITPRGAAFNPAPDNTTVYRISYSNVDIVWSNHVMFVASQANLYFENVRFVFAGTGTQTEYQIGKELCSGGAGAHIYKGCEWNLSAGGSNKANVRVHGSGRAIFTGDSTYWVGPNNPMTADDINYGNYFHDGTNISSNVGGRFHAQGCVVKNVTVAHRSFSSFAWLDCTLDNSPFIVSNGATGNFSGSSSSLRASIRNLTGTALQVNALGNLIALVSGNPALGNVQFSGITGDQIVVSNNGNAYIGDCNSSGTNTGWGLRVNTGGNCLVSSTTAVTGNLGAIQVDSSPSISAAQAVAAPYNGMLRSSTAVVLPIADPGNGGAIAVTSTGTCPLTSTGAQTRTVAAPTFLGQRLSVSCDVFAGNITITIATIYDSAGHNTITLTAAGQMFELEAVQVGGLKRWRLASNDGATLSTV
jgi:hypothetical protein